MLKSSEAEASLGSQARSAAGNAMPCSAVRWTDLCSSVEQLIKQYMSQWVRYPRGAGNASFDVGSSTSNSVTSHVESGGALLTPSGSMSDRNLHVIMACGGDGTFSWIASQAVKNGHDVMSGDEASPSGKGDSPGHGSKPSLQYCVIPFPLGTGNDMSGVLGWGRSLNCDPGTIRSLLCSVEESTSVPKCDVSEPILQLLLLLLLLLTCLWVLMTLTRVRLLFATRFGV